MVLVFHLASPPSSGFLIHRHPCSQSVTVWRYPGSDTLFPYRKEGPVVLGMCIGLLCGACWVGVCRSEIHGVGLFLPVALAWSGVWFGLKLQGQLTPPVDSLGTWPPPFAPEK